MSARTHSQREAGHPMTTPTPSYLQRLQGAAIGCSLDAQDKMTDEEWCVYLPATMKAGDVKRRIACDCFDPLLVELRHRIATCPHCHGTGLFYGYHFAYMDCRACESARALLQSIEDAAKAALECEP